MGLLVMVAVLTVTTGEDQCVAHRPSPAVPSLPTNLPEAALASMRLKLISMMLRKGWNVVLLYSELFCSNVLGLEHGLR